MMIINKFDYQGLEDRNIEFVGENTLSNPIHFFLTKDHEK